MSLPIRKPGQSSGGFLNGVSGVISAYNMTMREGESKGKSWAAHTVELTITPDGAEPTTQFFDAGFLRGDNRVSKDGQSITGGDNYYLDPSTVWGKFVMSFIGEGNKLTEEQADVVFGDLRSLGALMGTRVTFTRVKDEEETKRRGKRKVTSGPHAGKEFDRDVLLVSEVLALPDAKGGKKAATKPAAKGAAVAPSALDTSAADAAMQAILATKPEQTLEKTKLSSAVVQYAITAKLDTTQREALRKQLTSDEYLNDATERGVIFVAADVKGTPITLLG